MRLFVSLILFILFTACATQKNDSMSTESFMFLALGDSYTIGEAVNVDERWPVQLSKRLRQDSIKIDPVIVATQDGRLMSFRQA